MDVETGDILSLISLPNFDINLRTEVKDKKYTNKITGIYELAQFLKLLLLL